jgi:lysine 2,3-aminomutase
MTLNKLQALIDLLLSENESLRNQLDRSNTPDIFKNKIRKWIMIYINERPHLLNCTSGNIKRKDFDKLNWKDVAALRIIDYLDYAGIKVQDPSISMKEVVSDPFAQLFEAIKYKHVELRHDFVMDMIMLFRQYSGKLKKSVPSKKKVVGWLDRHPSGTDPEIVAIRNQNRDRILLHRLFIGHSEITKVRWME